MTKHFHTQLRGVVILFLQGLITEYMLQFANMFIAGLMFFGLIILIMSFYRFILQFLFLHKVMTNKKR